MRIFTSIEKHLDDPDEWRFWSMHFELAGVYRERNGDDDADQSSILVPLELTLASELHRTHATPGIFRVGGDDGITFAWDGEKVKRQ